MKNIENVQNSLIEVYYLVITKILMSGINVYICNT